MNAIEKSRSVGDDLAAQHKETPKELRVMAAFAAKWPDRSPPVKVVTKNGNDCLVADHPDQTLGLMVLMDAIGATEFEFVQPFLVQIANAASAGTKAE
jgi:hypothetical protein